MNHLMGKEGMDAVTATEEKVQEVFKSNFNRRMQHQKAFSAYDPSQVDQTKMQLDKGDSYRRWIGEKLTGRSVLITDEA